MSLRVWQHPGEGWHSPQHPWDRGIPSHRPGLGLRGGRGGRGVHLDQRDPVGGRQHPLNGVQSEPGEEGTPAGTTYRGAGLAVGSGAPGASSQTLRGRGGASGAREFQGCSGEHPGKRLLCRTAPWPCCRVTVSPCHPLTLAPGSPGSPGRPASPGDPLGPTGPGEPRSPGGPWGGGTALSQLQDSTRGQRQSRVPSGGSHTEPLCGHR